MNYAEKLKSYPIHWALGGSDAAGGLEQNATELLAFCKWMEENKIKTFLEIGMAKGYLSKFLTECGFICIGITDNESMLLWKPQSLFIGDSQNQTIIDSVGPVDLILVDGDHNKVDSDFFAYKDKCKFIAFHDICGLRDCEAVSRFWNNIKQLYVHYEFIDSEHPGNSSGIGVLDLSQMKKKDDEPEKVTITVTGASVEATLEDKTMIKSLEEGKSLTNLKPFSDTQKPEIVPAPQKPKRKYTKKAK